MTSTSLTGPDTSAAEALRARQALGFDNAPDIESLFPLPTARDRRLFRALLREVPAFGQSTTVDMYKAQRTKAQIMNTVSGFMNGSRMLIQRLGAGVLSSASLAQVRATPLVVLERVLNSTQSQDLADQLLKKLRWYGANRGEQTPASVRNQLLCNAICLYLNGPSADNPQELAGFNWQDPAHWGKNYQTLRNDFEQHLLHTRRVANTKEAILAAHLLQTRLSKDFAVPDIPADIRYKSSVVWVNFMHGVLLAEELDLPALSFQQLVNLPLERSVTASPEELEKIAQLRLGPALEWAVCVGIIQSRTASDYGEEDIKRALTALETHSESLRKAVLSLDLRPPERLKMAKQIKDDLFGSRGFESDGRRLVPEDSNYIGAKSTPTLNLPGHEFVDLYADGQIVAGKRWVLTQSDGKTRTVRTLRIDDRRKLYSELMDSERIYRKTEDPGPSWIGRLLPDINAQFDTDFNKYLASIKSAYQTLIISLLTSLPLADRLALEKGEVVVLSLRQRIQKNGQVQEVRARKGFLLQVTNEKEGGDKNITYYELIPNAGYIRERTSLRFSTIDGVLTEFPLHASIPGQTFTPGLSTSLLIDWPAHLSGRTPASRASSSAIVDPVGFMPAIAISGSNAIDSQVTPLESSRLNAVAHYIATNFLYVDEQELRIQARGMTVFDTIRARNEKRQETFAAIAKGFVPFWGSIEDLLSDDTKSKLLGGVGLVVDLASFLFPVGKFMSGSVRLIRLGNGVSSMAVKASLPSFSSLTRNLLIASAKNLNPLDGLPTLLKSMASGAGRGLLATGRLSLVGIKKLTGQADNYRLAHNLPQAIDPGSWKPLTNNDHLATINGIDDVLVRHTNPSDLQRFHLVDPVTSLPYGPRLFNNHRNIRQGRSTFKMQPPTESHALAELSEHAHIREVLEVDGRTTLFVDDIPYRLDGNQLRRADLIDDRSLFKSVPCRVRRAPGDEICKTIYVTRAPAPTPAIGSLDESKGWAPWFGDSIYKPAISTQPLLVDAIKTYKQLNASLEFQKGIFARIKVHLPYDRSRLFDTLEVGAVIVPAKDNSKHYVITRLNAGDFYGAERLPGQSLSVPLTLRKAHTLPAGLVEELKTVYIGSLNANNMVRIHGAEAVERAMKTMDDIAIPIGGHVNPPDTLKLLKVDTSPGEAVLFDHSTRSIVRKSTDGAATWTLSRDASDSVRETTAEVFNNLFQRPVITVTQSTQGGPKALKIDDTMRQLQKHISNKLRRPLKDPRNIAFAEIKTKDGTREIYVSVSGSKGDTDFLPLFEPLANKKEVTVDGIRYFNIDSGVRAPQTSLGISAENKLVAIPHTIENIETYTPALTARPTSLDTEAKLISVIRDKYPDPKTLDSVTIATTMAPCDSCSVVMKQFGYDGSPGALNVLWK
ncbi:hypothetical protein DKY63_27790 [Pseudomonas putida]|uniref:Uncharacterized protein n=1 Tax=Pseudomonas putida TaxID=303 RepID=A0A2Z4RRB7_PSEPU|nr:deaminase domain-containing protein [Pseudomonas putida]AWY43517.1 hypothetical protein DKY63_27790 [Pseudomonas putida]